MQHQLLVVLDSQLKVAHGNVLIGSVGHENRTRAIEVLGVVAVQMRDVGAVVDNDAVKAYSQVSTALVSQGYIG